MGGQPAEFADFRSALSVRAPLLVLAVVVASGLTLLAVFRAPLLPAVAIGLNLLAIGAAFGLLTLLFQGAAPLGGPGFVDAVSLAAAYAVVFGLSIDYYVFLIARMREEKLSGRTAEEAVFEGLRSTGAVVTGAAAIMIAIFTAFAFAETAAIRQLGTALALAVLIDATVIRLVLLPAVMRLLGDAAWSVPRLRGRRLPGSVCAPSRTPTR